MSTAVVGDNYAESLAAFQEALELVRDATFGPSPRLDFETWARQNVVLSPETTARPGPFRPLLYQPGIMEAISDPRIHTVSVVKPTQVGYTALLELAIAYFLEHDPSAILFYMPTDADVRRFHDDHFMPIVKNTAALDAILRRDGEWNIRRTDKGSRVTFLSAFNVKNVQSHRGRVAIIDEISSDAYNPSGAIKEDKINAAMERTASFPMRKNIIGGTPSVAGRCRITSWFLRGDQRRWFVPDPETGELHEPVFGDRSTPHGLKWDGRDASSVRYRFPSGAELTEREFDRDLMPEGSFVPTAEGEPGHASFAFNALISPMPGANWDTICRKWFEARDQVRENPGPMKSFYNTVLGQAFEDFEAKKGVKSLHELQELQEHYETEVPPDVNFLTAGVDVQSGEGGWFAVKVVGWGYNERAHVIGYWVLKPDRPFDGVHEKALLEEFLRRPFKGANGQSFFIQAAAIDSGGHWTQEVYDFAEANRGRRWWAIKGRAQASGERLPVWPKEVSVSDKGKFYIVGVDAAKDTLFRRLHGDGDAPTAIRFPLNQLAGAVPMDADFFGKLTKEKKVFEPGKAHHKWSSPRGQEPWDCLVYAYAALQGLRSLPGGNRFAAWTGKPPDEAARLAAQRKRHAQEGAADPGKPKPPKRKRRWGVVA